MTNRIYFLDTKQNVTDLVANFPIICYNYLNFLKKSFRSYDFLSILNTPCRYKIKELARKKQIAKTLEKIKKEYKSDIKTLEDVFLSLEKMITVHEINYSDSEKLIFSINFFNLKLIHHLLFHYLIDENKEFPSSPYNWLDFCEKLKFKLFGVDFSLLDLDISVIRYHKVFSYFLYKFQDKIFAFSKYLSQNLIFLLNCFQMKSINYLKRRK